jgi:hypothetical protein
MRETSTQRDVSATPGQWNASGIFIAADPGGADDLILIGEASYKFVPLRVAMSNARLMAAAPGLLEALQRIVAAHDAGPCAYIPYEDLAFVRSAIAKAEGQ